MKNRSFFTHSTNKGLVQWVSDCCFIEQYVTNFTVYLLGIYVYKIFISKSFIQQWKWLVLKMNYIMIIKLLLTDHCIFPSPSLDKGAFYSKIKNHKDITKVRRIMAYGV